MRQAAGGKDKHESQQAGEAGYKKVLMKKWGQSSTVETLIIRGDFDYTVLIVVGLFPGCHSRVETSSMGCFAAER